MFVRILPLELTCGCQVLVAGDFGRFPFTDNNFIDFIFDMKISVPSQSIQQQIKQGKIKGTKTKNFRKLSWKGPSSKERVRLDTSSIRLWFMLSSPKFKMVALFEIHGYRGEQIVFTVTQQKKIGNRPVEQTQENEIVED